MKFWQGAGVALMTVSVSEGADKHFGLLGSFLYGLAVLIVFGSLWSFFEWRDRRRHQRERERWVNTLSGNRAMGETTHGR